MCRTSQYWYTCWHPATHPSRVSMCPSLNSRYFWVGNEDTMFSMSCRRCTRDHKVVPSAYNIDPVVSSKKTVLHNTWYVPSRSLSDIGPRRVILSRRVRAWRKLLQLRTMQEANTKRPLAGHYPPRGQPVTTRTVGQSSDRELRSKVKPTT